MDKRFPGILIRIERLKKDWSQSGLCNGICAVSYLSKIEQGKADASPEIIRLLLQRLGISWYDDFNSSLAEDLIEQLYQAIFTYDRDTLTNKAMELEDKWSIYSNSPYMLDCLLIKAYVSEMNLPDIIEYETCFEQRQLILWFILNDRYDELIQLSPSAYSYYCVGSYSYQKGNYPKALEQLQRGYNLAAEDGLVFIMLGCRLLMGNCYSNTLKLDSMLEHYRVAERLAAAIGDDRSLEDIQYNIASTELEMGHIQQSYDYFIQRKTHSVMSLHKLAVCCEKLGKPLEALEALDKAKLLSTEFPTMDISAAMCDLVRYRLEHVDYLKDVHYGEILTRTFHRIQKELPSGYITFHLPWMLEWYTATRQYKQAYELISEFSSYQSLK